MLLKWQLHERRSFSSDADPSITALVLDRTVANCSYIGLPFLPPPYPCPLVRTNTFARSESSFHALAKTVRLTPEV